MSDDFDPFAGDESFRPDLTMRPRPGHGRPGGTPVAPSPTTPPPTPLAAVPGGPIQLFSGGLNILVQAASPLLLLAARQRGSVAAPDVERLREYALDEIRRFEERVQASGTSETTMVAARYALCAAVDEAVLSTPWGARSDWAQQTLLLSLHNEASGGVKFFVVLDGISQQPTRHIELMELYYLCLAFGFAGRYETLSRGYAQLAEIQRDLYTKIRAYREAPPAELALRWRGIEDRRNRLFRYVPWWVVGIAAIFVLVIAFITYSTRLGRIAEPVLAQIDVGLPALTPSSDSPQLERPQLTIKSLLEPDERIGRLTVFENGRESRVVIEDLFASGSTALKNADYEATLRQVTDALNQVPGQVIVEGHTDDEPTSATFRYQNNTELSYERARTVRQVIDEAIDNTGRVTIKGLGSDFPRYEPPAEYRARNRRVEIVHTTQAETVYPDFGPSDEAL